MNTNQIKTAPMIVVAWCHGYFVTNKHHMSLLTVRRITELANTLRHWPTDHGNCRPITKFADSARKYSTDLGNREWISVLTVGLQKWPTCEREPHYANDRPIIAELADVHRV